MFDLRKYLKDNPLLKEDFSDTDKKIRDYITNGSVGNLDLRGHKDIRLPDNLMVDGSLFLTGTNTESLPENLHVTKNIWLNNTPIKRLPDSLQFGGSINLYNTKIETFPSNLNKINGFLDLTNTPNTSLPDNLQTAGNVILSGSGIVELPKNFKPGGDLRVDATKLTKLTDDLYVWDLDISNSLINVLPNRLQINGDLTLTNTSLSKKYTKTQIQKMIEDKGGYVKGTIYI